MNVRRISSIQSQIADILRAEIISGELPVGEKLNELELAKRFGVSRGPIRDVLLLLGKEGLTLTKGSAGTCVAQPMDSKVEKVLNDVRLKIEEFAIKQLKQDATHDDIANLESILNRMSLHCDRAESMDFINADIDFHKYCVEQAGGTDLVNVWYPIVLRMHMNKGLAEINAHDVEEHAAIINALKEKDSKAAITALRQNIK
ncbi:GntR family transcriptional regulator [Saccharobesus litoralis]|uniref:GntR family transcriptional regulator n=1 Tax=Saccharobesus litoralis TaxID=2172099 RepID=UPI0019008F1C|nr:GntR family transcriptional regulator [Saccharobesus litoralis]